MKAKIIIVIIAAGKMMTKFVLNLSFIVVSCVRTAAIVVSEIIDKLSPNIPPPMTAATGKATGIPRCSATLTAIGVSATTVPVDVPIDIEIKQLTTKTTTINKLGGSTVIPELTMESTAPVAAATAANAPAKMKINARQIILLSPAPLQKISSLWLKLSFLFINKEKILAMRMATMTGILNSPVKMAVPIYNK